MDFYNCHGILFGVQMTDIKEFIRKFKEKLYRYYYKKTDKKYLIIEQEVVEELAEKYLK